MHKTFCDVIETTCYCLLFSFVFETAVAFSPQSTPSCMLFDSAMLVLGADMQIRYYACTENVALVSHC